MENFSTISFILGALLFAAVVAFGVWMYKIKRYHIFYFIACGLLPVSLDIYWTYMFRMINDSMDSSGPTGYLSDASAQSYNVVQDAAPHSWFDLLSFMIPFCGGLFLLVALLSIVNPFIKANKLSVKIVSIVMIVLGVLCGLLLNALSGIGKIGG